VEFPWRDSAFFCFLAESTVARRTIEIPLARPLAALLLLMAAAGFALFLAHSGLLPFIGGRLPGGAPTPEAGSGSGDLAQEVAVAINAVDFREPDSWLASLQPLSTADGFQLLKMVYMPMTWGLFERDRRVIPRERVVAVDKGILAEGQVWQVRLVTVTIADPSASPDPFDMRILLVLDGDVWKFASLLTQVEVDRLVRLEEGRP
jgi:hypothetical protein